MRGRMERDTPVLLHIKGYHIQVLYAHEELVDTGIFLILMVEIPCNPGADSRSKNGLEKKQDRVAEEGEDDKLPSPATRSTCFYGKKTSKSLYYYCQKMFKLH